MAKRTNSSGKIDEPALGTATRISAPPHIQSNLMSIRVRTLAGNFHEQTD
jgi:hypothetical protein